MYQIFSIVNVIFIPILDPKTANTLYRCFSVYTNTRRFLTFNTVPGALECIDGIRAISMLWVVVGHTYSFTLMAYIHNMADTVAVRIKILLFAHHSFSACNGPMLNSGFAHHIEPNFLALFIQLSAQKLFSRKFIHNVCFQWLTKFSSTWINSAPITVDTFFCLSGILAVYTTVGKISRGQYCYTKEFIQYLIS